MKFRFITLPNGLRVVHIPRASTGTVALSLCGDVGSIHEDEHEIGVAHLLEHVVFEGTNDFPLPEEATKLVADAGGRQGASTSWGTTEYRARVLKQDIERAFVFLSQVVLHPLITEESVSRNKKVIVQEIGEKLADPRREAVETLSGLLYPGHRLGVILPGFSEHVRSLKAEITYAFWERHYVPSRFVLSVCGDIDEETTLNLSRKYFGTWSGETSESDIVIPPGQDDARFVSKKKDTGSQLAIALGYYAYRAGDPKRPAALLLAKILGQGGTARLYRRLRIGDASVYSAASFVHSSKYHGVFFITAVLSAEQWRSVLTNTAEELHDMMSAPPGGDELAGALKRIEAGDLFNMESSQSTASYYSKLFIEQPESEGHEEEIEKFRRVSVQDIKDVAQEVFSQQPKVIVVGSKCPSVSEIQKVFE